MLNTRRGAAVVSKMIEMMYRRALTVQREVDETRLRRRDGMKWREKGRRNRRIVEGNGSAKKRSS